MKDLSVIICCYNSGARIPKTLEYLSRQKINSLIDWEIVLVNNNSNDGTSEIAGKVWEELKCSVPLHIIDERTAGLSFARETGIQNALSEILVFCDDDNWLFETYIETAYKIMESNRSIAVLGGQGLAKTEIDPPQEMMPFLDQYAIGPQAEQSGDVTDSKGYVYGAGMVMRKSYYMELKQAGFSFSLSGRKGGILTSGEDFELCAGLAAIGKKIWYDEDLKFYHFLTKERLNVEYLLRMNSGFGYSLAFLLPYIYNKGFKRFRFFKFKFHYILIKHILILIGLGFKKIYRKDLSFKLQMARNFSLIKSLLANKNQLKESIRILQTSRGDTWAKN